MGNWYLVILVVHMGTWADMPPRQVWGPFLSADRCAQVAREIAHDPQADWVVPEAICVEGPHAPREMEVKFPDGDR